MIMSQFCIITGKEEPEINIEGIELLPFDESQQFVKKVIKHYRLPINETWLIADETGDTTDEIFSEASYRIASGDKFSQTRLGILIGCILKTKCRIIAWYASDFNDLDKINNPVELIDALYKKLPVGSGEIYIDYQQ
jgi:hypothetical protein